MRQFLNNWYIKSIIAGLIIGLLSLIPFANVKFGILVFVIVTVFLIINNPKRRYMRAFWMVFSAFVTLNKFSLWVAGSIFEIDFRFESSVLDWTVSIFLILLSAILLILDYIERSDKKFNFWGLININSKYIKGNYTNIDSGANVTQIIVHGDYIEGNGKTKKFSDFDELKQLLVREEELQILVSNLDNSVDGRSEEYQKELKEIQLKTEQTKQEIIDISKTINLLSSKYPEEATTVSQFLMDGFYGSAKDYFMHLQEERQDKRLAEKIGIDYDELLQLDHWVEEGHTSSDGMIYYYNIWFSGESPLEIIEKISGVEKLGDSYCLEVSPWFFEEPEDNFLEN